MHLLNALPQRLDPGATPTFAGLISATLTSPASTNLTLGLGTGGTALTLASSTLAATFAGVVVVPDGSAAAPSLVVSSSPTTGFYRHGSGAIGFSSAGLACAAFSSNTGGGGLYLEALGTNQNIRLVPSGTGILTTAAPVTFTNTTAGASNVGALVVAGGLATGADSFFGGSRLLAQKDQNAPTRIQARNDNSGTSAQSQVSATLGDFTTYTAMGSLSAGFTTSGLFAANAGYIASNATAGLNIFTVGATSLTLGTNSTAALTLASGGAATFAGAVRMSAYGAGAATFDSSGNITSASDARLKNITGTFTKGLAEIVKLTPKIYTWKPESGLVTDDINATLIAQDLIAAGIPEAVTTYRTVAVIEDDVQSAEDIAAGKPVTQHAKLDADGKPVTQRVDANYSVSDRTVIAALVNAVKELKAEIDALKAK